MNYLLLTDIGKYAYEFAKKLSFPRLVGSKGEKKALKILNNEFKTLGFNNIYREKFETSFYNWFISRIAFVPLCILLIFAGISLYINPFLSLGTLFCLIFFYVKGIGLMNSTEIKLYNNPEKNYETENIYAKCNGRDNNSKTIILIAHWDTKSQMFSSSFRIFLFLTLFLGLMSVTIFYLTLSIIQLFVYLVIPWLFNILLIVSFFLLVVAVINSFNKTSNESLGSIDNAASIGVLFELARHYKKNPLQNTQIGFLSTSSEELNLGGAKHFLKTNTGKLDKNRTFIINLDTVGYPSRIRLIDSYGIPKKSSSKYLNNLFMHKAKILGIEIENSYLPTGAWGDYMPFVKEGYQSCWLASESVTKYLHTKNDTMKLVSKEVLRDTILLCKEVLGAIDSDKSRI